MSSKRHQVTNKANMNHAVWGFMNSTYILLRHSPGKNILYTLCTKTFMHEAQYVWCHDVFLSSRCLTLLHWSIMPLLFFFQIHPSHLRVWWKCHPQLYFYRLSSLTHDVPLISPFNHFAPGSGPSRGCSQREIMQPDNASRQSITLMASTMMPVRFQPNFRLF